MSEDTHLNVYPTRRNTTILVLTAVLVTAAVLSFSFAKYLSNEDTDGTVVLEDFGAALHLYYTDDGEEQQEVTIDSNSYVELTLEQFAAATVALEYTGDAMTYCRFKVDLSFIHYIDENGDGTADEAETVPHTYPTCTYDEAAVYDNQEEDGYFYIMGILPDEIDIPSPVLTVTDIGEDAGDLINDDDSSTHVRIALSADCVQFNRVEALWGISALPWE